MNVIGHYDEGGQFIPLAVEVSECVGDDGGQGRIPEEAGPVALIQPVVDPSGETIAVASRCLRIPGSGIASQPKFALRPPLIQFGLGKRVSQAPSHEYELVALLPVGQAVMVNVKGSIGVEIEAGAVCWPPIP